MRAGSASGSGSTSAYWVLLCIAPLIAYYPIVFGRYTLARSYLSSRENAAEIVGAVGWPVTDTVASAQQDEPWLAFIGRSLRRGELPLVNLNNALGAPLLESMQSGVLYPLNLVLVALPLSSPLYFDIFCLLHVYVLLFGLTALFRLYARLPIAVGVAILIGLGGVTQANINMVHYRSFVWLPWMLWGAMHFARGTGRRSHLATLFFATLAAMTAGSIQDFAMSCGATGVLFLLEWIPERGWLRPRQTLAFTIGGIAGLLVGSAAILPYLVSVKEGNLYSIAIPSRSLEGVPAGWMLTWILPRCMGFMPSNFVRSDYFYLPQSDFTTTGDWLVLLALVACCAPGPLRSGRHRSTMIGIFLFSLLGLLKVAHLPIFDFVQHLPILNCFRWHKYSLCIHVTLGLLGAWGLEEVARRLPDERRKLVSFSLLLASALVAGTLVLLLSDSHWNFQLLDNRRLELEWRLIAGVSIGVMLTAGWLLYACPETSPGRVWHALCLLFVVQAAVLQPLGFFPGKSRYHHPLGNEVAAADAQFERLGERRLSCITPNENLHFGFEHFGVFDPISNRYFRDFVLKHLRPFNAVAVDFLFAMSQAPEGEELNALRILGVNRIEGYALPPADGVQSLQRSTYALEGSLPRAFAISAESLESLNAHWSDGTSGDLLARLRGAIRDGAAVKFESASGNTVRVRAERDFDGYLVLNQAYSTNWSLAGERPLELGKLFPAWKVSLKDGETLAVRYWPRGLTWALGFAGVGFLLGVAAWRLIPRGVDESCESLRQQLATWPAALREALHDAFPRTCRDCLLTLFVLWPLVWRCGLPMHRLYLPSLPELKTLSPISLTMLGTNVPYNLDLVGETSPALTQSFEVRTGETPSLTISGWAVDISQPQAAAGVYVDIGGRLFEADYITPREDVALRLGNPQYVRCGFRARIPISRLPTHPEELSLKVVSRDRRHYYETPCLGTVCVLPPGLSANVSTANGPRNASSGN